MGFLSGLIQLPTITSGGASARGSHRLAEITECERKWWLRYVQLLRPKEDTPWRLTGTLIHTVLSYYYASLMVVEKQPEWYRTVSLQDALVRDGAGHPGEIRLAKEAVAAYIQLYGDREPWSPFAVEQEYRASIGVLDPGGPDSSLDGEQITCRTDLIVEDINGELWAVDHKTQSGQWGHDRLEPWNEGNNEYALSWQAMVNLIILRANGLPIEGFIINRIKRKKPFDFDRHTLSIPAPAYAMAGRVARAQVAHERAVLARLAAGQEPIPHFWSCVGRFGVCDYAPLCKANDEAERDATLALQYEVLK